MICKALNVVAAPDLSDFIKILWAKQNSPVDRIRCHRIGDDSFRIGVMAVEIQKSRWD